MIISEDGQELLEGLWIEIVEGKKENPLSALMALADALLELRSGLLVTGPDEALELTEGGILEARKVIRRHRLAERLFHDVLDIKEEVMEKEACRYEHVISEEVEESICTLLGHPEICPHGKPIPSGRCCEDKRETVNKVVSSLSEMKEDQSGKIVYVLMKNHDNLHKLLAMGVLPGMEVRLIERYPSFVFQVGETQMAVDEAIARDIYVRIRPEEPLARQRRRRKWGNRNNGECKRNRIE